MRSSPLAAAPSTRRRRECQTAHLSLTFGQVRRYLARNSKCATDAALRSKVGCVGLRRARVALSLFVSYAPNHFAAFGFFGFVGP